MQRVSIYVLVAACALLVVAQSGSAQNKPFPQHVTYEGSYIKPNNFDQATLDSHVTTFYNYWVSTYLTNAGTNGQGKQMYRILKDGSSTVSEGQGYGLVLTAYMAGFDATAQARFNGLYYYVQAHPSAINNKNMQWNIDSNGNAQGGSNSAWDGDADISYGLLVAHEQWGSSGEINYLSEAQTRMTGMKETMGPQSLMPLLGDWVTGSNQYNQYDPRTSDFMYDHFLSWSKYHTGNKAYWESVLDATKGVVTSLQNTYASSTGLLPDFATYSNGNYQPASAGFLEGGNDGNFYYNAGRDPWRIGTYALVTGDATARAQLGKISAWISSQSSIQSGYTLSGGVIGNYFSSFFASPLALSAMTDTSKQTFLNNAYAQVYNNHNTYYEDSVNLQCLLVMTGNWWQPGLSTTGGDGSDGGSDGSDGSSASSLHSWLF